MKINTLQSMVEGKGATVTEVTKKILVGRETRVVARKNKRREITENKRMLMLTIVMRGWIKKSQRTLSQMMII